MTDIGHATHFVPSTFSPMFAFSVHYNGLVFSRYVTAAGSCEKSNGSSGPINTDTFLTTWATTRFSNYTLFPSQSYMVTIYRI
jgi:hypothetical protein